VEMRGGEVISSVVRCSEVWWYAVEIEVFRTISVRKISQRKE
jgi:hypothetical protein